MRRRVWWRRRSFAGIKTSRDQPIAFAQLSRPTESLRPPPMATRRRESCPRHQADAAPGPPSVGPCPLAQAARARRLAPRPRNSQLEPPSYLPVSRRGGTTPPPRASSSRPGASKRAQRGGIAGPGASRAGAGRWCTSRIRLASCPLRRRGQARRGRPPAGLRVGLTRGQAVVCSLAVHGLANGEGDLGHLATRVHDV